MARTDTRAQRELSQRRKLELISANAQIGRAKIYSLEIDAAAFYAFVSRGFWARLKWLLFGR